MVRVVACPRFVAVQRDGDPVAENRQKRANGYRDGAHRPNVHPNRHAKSCRGRRRHSPSETGYDPDGEQESRGADRKALHPSREPMQILFEAPKAGRVLVDPVAQQRGSDQSKCVDEGTLNGSEDRPVHDRQGVGHRKRGRCDDDEDRDRKRIGERADRSDLVGDPRLVTNYQEREHERRREQPEGGSPAKEALQAMVIEVVITLLCGVGLYASLFMLNKSRRAARGEIKGPSVVKTSRAHLFGVPNSLLGSLYYPAIATAVWLVHGRIGEVVALAAVVFAAATSVVLGYSLLFVTRRECPYCWTSHVVNWCLLLLCGWLFLPNILNRGI